MVLKPNSINQDVISDQIRHVVKAHGSDGLVFVKMPKGKFPNKQLDFSRKLNVVLKRNPQVKIVWDDKEIEKFNGTKGLVEVHQPIGTLQAIDKVREINYPKTMVGLLDMTLISVFYDD